MLFLDSCVFKQDESANYSLEPGGLFEEHHAGA